MRASRVLVAGVGNVLTADDGFGVRVVEALCREGGLPSDVRLVDVGIGGIHLVQELMDGYNALIVLDAVERGGEPGTVYTLVPTVPEIDDLEDAERSGFLADTHYAVPAKALMLARALDVLPDQVYIVGCQPASVELGLSMSDQVTRAVPRAAARVRELLAEMRDGDREDTATGGSPGPPTTDAIRIRDEILEVLYWLRGEGIHEQVGPEDLRPFVQLEPGEAREHLEALVAAGLLDRGERASERSAVRGVRYRLSERGSREAARRFVEAFAPILGRGHGTACAPGCDCHDPEHPDESCPTHGSRAHLHRS